MKTSISVEVSPGELIDKITILEIKLERIEGKDKLKNVKLEWETLTRARDEAIEATPELEKLMAAAVDEGRAAAPPAAPGRPEPQPQAWSAPPRHEPQRDERYRDDRNYDDRGRPRKKKRDSIFDIFEFD